MLRELLGCEHELAIRRALSALLGVGVVVAVDHQLALDRNRFVLGVIEVDPGPEAAGGGLAELTDHIVGPEDDHALRGAVFRLDRFRLEPLQRIADCGWFYPRLTAAGKSQKQAESGGQEHPPNTVA